MDLFPVMWMIIRVISQIALIVYCCDLPYRRQLNHLLTNAPQIGRPGHDLGHKILRQLNKQRATHCCFQPASPPVEQAQRLLSRLVPLPLAVLVP